MKVIDLWPEKSVNECLGKNKMFRDKVTLTKLACLYNNELKNKIVPSTLNRKQEKLLIDNIY